MDLENYLLKYGIYAIPEFNFYTFNKELYNKAVELAIHWYENEADVSTTYPEIYLKNGKYKIVPFVSNIPVEENSNIAKLGIKYNDIKFFKVYL